MGVFPELPSTRFYRCVNAVKNRSAAVFFFYFFISVSPTRSKILKIINEMCRLYGLKKHTLVSRPGRQWDTANSETPGFGFGFGCARACVQQDWEDTDSSPRGQYDARGASHTVCTMTQFPSHPSQPHTLPCAQMHTCPPNTHTHTFLFFLSSALCLKHIIVLPAPSPDLDHLPHTPAHWRTCWPWTQCGRGWFIGVSIVGQGVALGWTDTLDCANRACLASLVDWISSRSDAGPGRQVEQRAVWGQQAAKLWSPSHSNQLFVEHWCGHVQFCQTTLVLVRNHTFVANNLP